ncbi:14936_t:CDS:2 [Dentiscutata erythropus]|uniref:14936_t:CDS:1 n=1 Tax=Dentiscutata erythropus TaxID=1348616 RepID=A0A9N8ZXI6_9GLOM|nr:14936_t:CDS:2 [Dentiscutata erythropus]
MNFSRAVRNLEASPPKFMSRQEIDNQDSVPVLEDYITINNEKRNEGDVNDDVNVQFFNDGPYLSDEQGCMMFIPTYEMQTLPTKIYKNNMLQAEERQKLLQLFSCNKLVRFKPPPMDKDMSRRMQKNHKEFDKMLYKILYHTSAVLRPLDNAIKMAYETKPPPDKKEAGGVWGLMESALLLTRPLFEDDLATIIFKENEKNKFFNDALWQKQRTQRLSNNNKYKNNNFQRGYSCGRGNLYHRQPTDMWSRNQNFWSNDSQQQMRQTNQQ